MSRHLVSSSLALIALAAVACEPAEPSVQHARAEPTTGAWAVNRQRVPACEPQLPVGSVVDVATPIGDADPAALQLGPLYTCASQPNGGYLAVRGHGSHATIGTAAFNEFLRDVWQRVRGLGIETSSIGFAACNDSIDGPPGGGRFSVSINDWRQVDAVVAVIDQVLRQRDLDIEFGVSVLSTSCGGFEL